MKKLLFFIIVIIILGGVTGFIIRQKRAQNENTDRQPAPLISEEDVSLNTWRTYKDDLGYSIKMPPRILVNTSVGPRSVHLLPDIESGEFGPTNFIYISVVSRDDISNDKRVYNYNSKQFLELMEMEIGEEKSLIPNPKDTPDLNEWFIYERLADKTINGETTRVFINRKPWEFPLGVTELRYVIPTEEIVFIIGGYYGGDVSYASLTRSDVEKIIATFKVL